MEVTNGKRDTGGVLGGDLVLVFCDNGVVPTEMSHSLNS